MCQAQAQVLPKDSPERKQLIAMGYELDKENPTDTLTIAKLGTTKIVFYKNDERVAVARYFTRERKLNSTEELELLKIINKWNIDFAIQFSLDDDYVTTTAYIYGDHDSKTFAKVIRYLDRVDNVFSVNPRFLQLVNK